jgi:O-antigen/teichoic acid export membrane protein
MIKTLFRHSIIYGVANSLQNAVGFILLPVYTAYLSVSEIGLLEIFIVSISVLFNLTQLGLGSALFKYYSYGKESDDSRQKNQLIISSSFFFLSIFSLIIILILYGVRERISQILFNTSIYNDWITLILIIVFFRLFSVIPTAFLRIQNKSAIYSIINGAQFLFQIAIIIYLVVVLNKKIEGVLEGLALSSFIFAIIFVWIIKNNVSFNFSYSVVKELLSYSIFLVPVSIGIMILMMSNRFFILMFRDSEELGIFSVANKISSLILLAVMSFQLAWPSIMFRIRSLQNAKNYYSRIFRYFIVIFLTFALGLTFFSRELTLLFATREYLSGVSLIPILSLGYLFYGLFYVGTVGIQIYKRTYFLAISMIVGTAVNLLLNYFFTEAYGMWGASIALCISLIVVGITAFIFSQRVYFIRIEWNRILRFLLLLIIAFLLYQLGFHADTWQNFIAKIIILLFLFPLSLYWLDIFTPEEKKYFWENLFLLKRKFTK